MYAILFPRFFGQPPFRSCCVNVTDRSLSLARYLPVGYIVKRRIAVGEETDVVFCGEGPCGPKKKASEKLSDTAKELFYRRGIRAVGVDEIVSHAGVTKPSLYRSFASKDDLVTTCLMEYAEEGRSCWEETLAKAPKEPRARLSHVIQSFADKAACSEFRGCVFSNAAVEFPDPDHPVHIAAKQMKQELRDRLLLLIRELDVNRTEELADGLFLLLEGAAASCHLFGAEGPATALVPAAEALIDQYATPELERVAV